MQDIVGLYRHLRCWALLGWVAIFVQAENAQQSLSRDEAIDEIVADASMDRMGDKSFWQAVAENLGEDRAEVRGKIAQFFDKYLGKIKEALRTKQVFMSRVNVARLEKQMQDALSALYAEGIREAAKNRKALTGTGSQEAEQIGASSQIVEDALVQKSSKISQETLDFLNAQEHVTVYRAMQLIDGELYPPMAAKVKGEDGKLTLVEPTKLGQWYQAVERPDLIDPKTGKWRLNKGNGTAIEAAYNPYFHSSASPLNDQFSSAYKRDNLVVVEGKIPASELTSGYKAQYAKDSVGETKWHSGPVASKLKGDKARRVFLSRWFQATRIMPDAEVASIIAKTLEGENVAVPSNVVTPSLLEALKANGVRIEDKNAATEGGEVRYSNRNYSYAEMIAKNPIGGTVVPYSDVQKAFKADGTVDTNWLVKHVLSQCKTVQTKSTTPTHYVEVADIGRNVIVTSKGITHGIQRKNTIDPNTGRLPNTTGENAIGAIDIAETLANAIEVNKANGRGSLDVPYSHILVGITATENGNGATDYYAVRFVVEERKNQDPILVEANVLSRLYAENAKKLRAVSVKVAPKSVARTHTMPQFLYSIADMLRDVKEEFEDTFSNDVYRHFGMTRKNTDFSNGKLVTMPDGTTKRVGGLQFSTRPTTDSTGRELSEGQQAYFKDSKAVDKDGNLLVLYHQTENEFTVFDPRHEGAGTRDQQTPFGIFLKSSDRDIGVKGKKQMALYANITKPLVALNRENLESKLRDMFPEYAKLSDQHKALDQEYKQKHEQAKQAFTDYLAAWRKQHPNAGRSEIYQDADFDRLWNAEDDVIEEWEQKARELETETKEVLTNALEAAGYDGIFLGSDTGSWGRSTDAYIALRPEQVKNVNNLNPTENPDIRYSTRDTALPSDLDLALSAADEIVDGGGNEYWASLLESDPGIAGEAEEIKRLGKQLKKTEADLAEARRNLTLTDRKLKTRGIASLAATIMQDQKAGDVNHNDVQKRITAVLTEAYQKALDQLDAGADVSDAWETVYQEGVVKAADILLTDATHSEKISYKWYTKTLGEYLGEGAREYVEDSRRAANVPSLQAGADGKQRTAKCRPYRRVRAGSNGRQSAVPTGGCGREAGGQALLVPTRAEP